MKRISGILLAIIACVLACTEDLLKRNYPAVHTEVVVNLPGTGVTFSGSFGNAKVSDILDHGFVWSSSKSLSIASSNVTHLGVPTSNTFTRDVTSQLGGSESYVRAFVVTKATTVYGNLQQFHPDGKLPNGPADPGQLPGTLISDFNPKSGLAGDTLTITGLGFSENPQFNKVNFRYSGIVVNLKITKSTPTQIKALIPANIKQRTMTVEITTGDFKQTLDVPFTYKSPGLLSIEGSNKLCDTLTLNWESYSQTLGQLQINNTVVVPVKVTKSQIKIIHTLFAADLDIKMNTTGGYTDERQFTYTTSPTVTSTFPSTFAINDTLTVSYNFPGCYTYLFTGNNAASFTQVAGTLQNPKFVLRGFHTLPATFSVSTIYADSKGQYTFFTSPAIQPKPSPWTVMNDAPASLARANAAFFSLNGKGYVTCGTLANGTNSPQMWEYNPTSQQWNRMNDFPDFAGAGVTAFVIGSKAYIIFLSTTHFWSFDPATNVWTQLAFFPGTTGNGSRFVTAISGKGYVAGANGDLWEYDPSSNTWTSKQEAPGVGMQGYTSFTRTNKGVMIGLDENGFIISYIYDPATDSWQTISTNFKPGFSYLNLYTLDFGVETYLIDALTGITYKLPNDLSKPWIFSGYGAANNAFGSFRFVINGKGYIGLGQWTQQFPPYYPTTVVQFDPSKF